MKKIFLKFKFTEEEINKLKNISNDLIFVERPDTDINAIIGNYSSTELNKFKQLEWIQTASIGVEKYIKKNILSENTILTNAIGIHTQEVAQHTLAVILSMIKKLNLYQNNQQNNLWKDEGPVKDFRELKVTIVGLGDIGKTLAKMLKALGVYVIGVKQKEIEKPNYIDELYLSNELKRAISSVDIVVSILPGNYYNQYLFDLDTFKAMDKETIFINVGRGNLYKEETLLYVLDNNIIKGAALDVFEKEPLDPNSKLWSYENVLITPHAAGSFHLQSAHKKFFELVQDNIKRYINNQELKHIVLEREK